MNLKNAAMLAFLATLFLSILMAVDFLHTVLGILDGVIPAVAIVRSLICLLASLGLTLFFYVFHKGQSPR